MQPLVQQRHQQGPLRRAVFIDRDGVLNRLIVQGYVRHPDELEVLPEAMEALRRLASETDFLLVLLTNQSVVGRGDISRSQLDQIHARLLAQIEAAGGRLDLLQVCPHAPFLGCDCRKPRPGMLLEAARLLHLDLTQCWTIGDSVRDIQAGRSAGTRTGFIRYQGWHDEREWDRLVSESHTVDFVRCNLLEAVEVVLGLEEEVAETSMR